jgi:hypothetical protein
MLDVFLDTYFHLSPGRIIPSGEEFSFLVGTEHVLRELKHVIRNRVNIKNWCAENDTEISEPYETFSFPFDVDLMITKLGREYFIAWFNIIVKYVLHVLNSVQGAVAVTRDGFQMKWIVSSKRATLTYAFSVLIQR